MGLDMYLEREIYIGGHFDHLDAKGTIEISIKKGFGDNAERETLKFDPKKVDSIIEHAAYWRKANAIHKWFVDNVQEGKDDCGRYYVGREQLQALLDICKQLVEEKDASKAALLLPTQGGFFFGSTDYDEWYREDIKSTVKQLTAALKDERGYFYYHSSW